MLGGLYGIATAYLFALWGSMYSARWLSMHEQSLRAAAAFEIVRGLALGYIALAVLTLRRCAFFALQPATGMRGRVPNGTRFSGSCWRR